MTVKINYEVRNAYLKHDLRGEPCYEIRISMTAFDKFLDCNKMECIVNNYIVKNMICQIFDIRGSSILDIVQEDLYKSVFINVNEVHQLQQYVGSVHNPFV